MEEKSVLDASFEELKSALAGKKSPQEIQALFGKVGKAVEESYTPPAPTAQDIAEIVKSAVENAVRPLAVELATLKGQMSAPVRENGVVASRAITANGVKPEDLLLRSRPASKKLTQIEQLAFKSTGALKE